MDDRERLARMLMAEEGGAYQRMRPTENVEQRDEPTGIARLLMRITGEPNAADRAYEERVREARPEAGEMSREAGFDNLQGDEMRRARSLLGEGMREDEQYSGDDMFSRTVRAVREGQRAGDYDPQGNYRPFTPRRGEY